MTDFLKQVLLKEMEHNMKKLLPELEEMTEQMELIAETAWRNPKSINQALIFTLSNLQYIFEQLEAIEQATEQIQNDEPARAPSPDLEDQFQATLTCLQICKYIALRLNGVEQNVLAAPFQESNGALLLGLATKKRLKC